MKTSQNRVTRQMAKARARLRKRFKLHRTLMIVCLLSLFFPISAYSQADTTRPAISNVNFTNVGMTNATITWLTDEPADGKVIYGISDSNQSPAYLTDSTPLDPTRTTFHSQTLTGLLPSAYYWFNV